jgi:decaprenylphospho-beta-D-erythro-pentofuranosid-2-ulose 2-reductase
MRRRDACPHQASYSLFFPPIGKIVTVNGKSVLILGARSDIASATAHVLAARGYAVQLAARDAVGSLKEDARDLGIRYSVPVTLHDVDALDLASHPSFVSGLPVRPAVGVCAVGYMGAQAENERSIEAMATVLRSNFEGPASLLSVLANRMAHRGSGTLVGISSVAGLRGRASNYVYGSAKAGFTTFLSGLRNRMVREKTGVHVVTVLPGFVDTHMTAGMELPKALTAKPTEVGEAIAKAVERQRNIIYVRPVWHMIMLIIQHIPETIFKNLGI